MKQKLLIISLSLFVPLFLLLQLKESSDEIGKLDSLFSTNMFSEIEVKIIKHESSGAFDTNEKWLIEFPNQPDLDRVVNLIKNLNDNLAGHDQIKKEFSLFVSELPVDKNADVEIFNKFLKRGKFAEIVVTKEKLVFMSIFSD